MSDMARLCAKAMGLELGVDWNQGYVMLGGYGGIRPSRYDPLTDDAQAMALVKKVGLSISRGGQASPWWRASHPTGVSGFSPNLNRAIVECVAKMQAAKKGGW